MVPDPSVLLSVLEYDRPLVGLYDAPDPAPFAPLVEPKANGRACVFTFYRNWLRGQTLHLTRDNFGCGGAGRALCGVETRDRESFIEFLWHDEGLRATRELMAGWIDHGETYHMKHDHLLIGPARDDQYEHLVTLTFYVEPDQLSILQQGTYYNHAWDDPLPIIVPFGSGCMELVMPLDLDRPMASIGATDIAMRDSLPPNVLGFTVTKPLYEQLCALDEQSFLFKPFLQRLKKARARG